MSKIPTRTQDPGWVYKGQAGRFVVWHTGKMSYSVTRDAEGPVVGTAQHYNSAFRVADREHRVEKSELVGGAE